VPVEQGEEHRHALQPWPKRSDGRRKPASGASRRAVYRPIPERKPVMPISNIPLSLDLYNRSKLELWRVAADSLAEAPVGANPLVQTGLHLVLAWLRYEAGDPASLLELFGRPHGPLGPQLHLVGSVLGEPNGCDRGQLPPLWWQVVKTAYHLRWLELTATIDGE
jgi:hypothetical protein